MLLQTGFENSNWVPQKFEVDKFFRVYKQLKRKQHLATIYDIMMKHIHDVNLTKHLQKFTWKQSQKQYYVY